VVSVILIFEAFEHVAKDPFLILKTFLEIMLFSLFHLGECHGFLVSGHPQGKGCYWGVSLKVHHTIISHTC
jgi:hypothetical protein